ncbi:heme exporter protein CcmB [Rickettsiales bacterium]|nr:heme exporter protein CcmB [Rickettsiales bacterium]
MRNFSALFYREMFIGIRSIGNLMISLSFFLISIIIFILSLGPNPEILSNIGSAIIWATVIFTIILSTEQFFLKDFLDGSLKELQIIGYSPESIIISKVLVMWIFLILPLLLFTPLLSLMLQLQSDEIIVLVFSIILGSPSILLITSIGTLLTLQSKNNKVLLLILVYPIIVPILIFGVGSVKLSQSINDNESNFLVLIAIFLITLPITLISGRYALKEVNK